MIDEFILSRFESESHRPCRTKIYRATSLSCSIAPFIKVFKKTCLQKRVSFKSTSTLWANANACPFESINSFVSPAMTNGCDVVFETLAQESSVPSPSSISEGSSTPHSSTRRGHHLLCRGVGLI
ncbi:hypothetical protein BT93_L0330 [Corymbia citriodora subsp. variegata]|uniref:Uncharacterized protein n=1 Tax=Corymbia citriodora subsp. variegata TaxID=360336 RepID=A0A8T0CPZ5_CORYI|nr:hypothetical protein BT93_L0330 [Corymbia citriodora subsp. variegata]